MILQAQIAAEVVKNSFNTNPDTVFGVLVSILLAVIVGLVVGIVKVVKAGSKERKEHKLEMKSIFERHEMADNNKYRDMKDLSEKTLTAMTMVMSKMDELIRK